MLVINFSHPLLPAHLDRIAALSGAAVERVIEVDSQVDLDLPLAPQATALADRCDLSPAEWQTLPILVALPALASSAAVVLSEIHGRMGHFPAIVRMKPVPNAITTAYDIAELINLQAVRDDARQRRRS